MSFNIKQNDRAPSLSATLMADSVAVDLTGAIVRFVMRADSAPHEKVNSIATITAPTLGAVQYTWAVGDTDTPGLYNAEWEVTFPGNIKRTFPSEGYFQVNILPELETGVVLSPSAAPVFLTGVPTAGQVPTATDTTDAVWADPTVAATNITGIVARPKGGLGADTSASAGLPVFGSGSLNFVAAPTGAVVGTSDAQTLTNKTIDGGSNALANVPASALTGTLAATKGGFGADVSGATGLSKFSSGTPSFVAAPAGAVVGTTDAQTITNKTLDATNAIAAGALTGAVTEAHGGFGADVSAASGAPYFKSGALTFLSSALANVTALAALSVAGLDDGATCYVRSLKSYFVLDSSSTLTADAITIVTASGGTGRWLRLSNAHAYWATVSNWWINATSGNDENDGQSSSTPLKTHAELSRRWGSNAITVPVDATTGARVCTVNVMTSLPTSDALSASFGIPDNTVVIYVGAVETTLQTGTFTSVTTRVQSTNTPWQMTDTALAAANTWTSYLTNRVRITSGARANACSWVAKDQGSKQARFGEFMFTPYHDPARTASWPGFVGYSTVQTPVATDTYAVETISAVTIGNFKPRQLSYTLQAPFYWPHVIFQDLTIRSGQCLELPLPWNANTPTIQFIGCSVAQIETYALTSFINCFVGTCLARAGRADFYGCVIGVNTSTNIGLVGAGAEVYVHVDTLSQGFGYRGVNLNLSAAAAFDAVNATPQPGGHGVHVGRINGEGEMLGGGAMADFASTGTSVRIWGSGNAGSGINVGSGCTFVYPAGQLANITITGSTPGTNDVTLAGNPQARAWDDTNSVFTAKRTLSYANLAATIATTGFGGNAVDLTSGARFAVAA